MGGDRQQRHVQTGDVGAYGSAARSESLWLRTQSGETDYDQIRCAGHPTAGGSQVGLEVSGEQPTSEVGQGLACSVSMLSQHCSFIRSIDMLI